MTRLQLRIYRLLGIESLAMMRLRVNKALLKDKESMVAETILRRVY